MTAVITWYQPGGGTTDLSERVDNGGEERFSVTAMAEECSVGTSTIVARDPEGTLEPVGLNAFSIEETDSTGDDPYIYVGRMGQREQTRGRYLVGAGRDIEIELQDLNAIPSNYIVGDTEDGNRPAEDHEARINWAVANIPLITDDSLVIVESTVAMQAADYTGMTWQQVIEDCCRASGYQSFVWFNGATEEYGLVYAHSAGEWLTTDIRVSNVESEVDGVTTFALSMDARLTIDPSRVASRVFGRGDGVDGFRTNLATQVLHARRDVAMDFPTVKTLATLNARMDRALAEDLDSEEHILRGYVLLPSTLASQFKAGYRFECHATHLTGLQDDFTWMRLLQTTHTMVKPDLYRVDFEAEPLVSPDARVIEIVLMGFGDVRPGTHIEASDDGSTWVTVFDTDEVQSHRVEGFFYATVPTEHTAHRYWAVVYTNGHPGGFFGGTSYVTLSLLDGVGVDLLGYSREAVYPAEDYWKPNTTVGYIDTIIPYEATVSGSGVTLYGRESDTPFSGVSPGPVTGDFTGLGGDIGFGLATGVPASGTKVGRWEWDLGA